MNSIHPFVWYRIHLTMDHIILPVKKLGAKDTCMYYSIERIVGKIELVKKGIISKYKNKR